MLKERKCPKFFFGETGLATSPWCLLSQTSKFRKHMGVGILRVMDHRHDIALVTKTDLELFALQDMVKRLGLNIIE